MSAQPQFPNSAPPPGMVPPQQPKKKKPVFLIGCLGAIAFFVVIGIIIAVVAASTVGGGASSEPKELPKIGTPVKSDDLEFTLSDYACGVKVSDPTGELTPQGQFCKISVSVKNVGTKEAVLLDTAVKLKNGEAEYSASSDTLFVNDSLKFETVNPGNTVKGVIYFDVPKDVVPKVAKVSGNIFSSGKDIALE